MPYLGVTNIMMFFVIVGVAVIFIVAWIIKSESRVNLAKEQIKTLSARLESGEKERYLLSEKMSDLANSEPIKAEVIHVEEEPETKGKKEGASKKKLEAALKDKEALIKEKETLESENGNLKLELEEAKASLAEVYKALCEK
jgi:biopolymer transport protein ExbB/TolQ